MKRVALVLVLLAGMAEGKRVIEPDITRLCPSGKTWNAITQCLGRHGKVRVAKTSGATKLVKLSQTAESGWRMPGLYLYTQSQGGWSLSGMLRGDTWEVVSLQPVKLKDFVGYRFDVRRAERDASLSADGTSTMLRQTMAVFCSGSPFCASVTTSCDFYVDGKAHWAFRGRLEFDDGVVHVRGDRSKSGGECEQDEDVFLPERPEPLFD